LRLGLALIGFAGGACLAGCGTSKQIAGDQIEGNALTIYAGVPLRGASSVSGTAVLSGESMALAAIRGRIGRYRIALKALDDATIVRGGWDPGQTSANARLAVQDKTTIGYLGDLNSGASAVSIPVLNRAGIAQISPASTAVGLTSGGPGTDPGEPQKYYPTGARTFARVVPSDAVQAAAQVRLQLGAGCTKTFVVDDDEVDGQDTAESFEAAAQSSGLKVAGSQSFEPRQSSYSSLAAAVASSGADCVLISAITEDSAARVTDQIATALPHALIFGSAGLADSTYTDPAPGGLAMAIDPRVLITVATLDPRAYPIAGRRFLLSYAQRYGAPEPDAIFGYEAMSLMLRAISRATDGGHRRARRSQVVSAIFHTHDRHSVLGTYSIDANGDTTLKSYGVYRVVRGQLRFLKTINTGTRAAWTIVAAADAPDAPLPAARR
jgi:branched-chain amino acid transport system substrate-binding protein